MVDIDPGLGRTGIRPDKAQPLVARVAGAKGLTYMGLQCYAGQVQHLETPNERREKSLGAMNEASCAGRGALKKDRRRAEDSLLAVEQVHSTSTLMRAC